jgi:NAD(P)H-quinone oxidoreductase subunit N
MALITTGKQFLQALSQEGALGVYVPLEGGHEGRYQRRLRAAGYGVLPLTARGLGDLSSYLLNVHGVRPPHLGKKGKSSDAAVGYTYYIPPIATYHLDQLPEQSKGLVLWLLEGTILTSQELTFLANLPKLEPRLKVVIELGGDRSFTWKPLTQVLAA